MKFPLLTLLALLPSLAASAADTAYSALRVVGKKDREAMNHVVELRGRNGNPQPDVWKVTVEDPDARGGLREFDVQRGRVIAQRTPTARSFGRPMNFNQLNLDSDGLFTIVNQEAQKDDIRFSRLEYLLRAGTGGGTPVWDVELFEGKQSVARLSIAADSGAVLDRREARPEPEPRYTDRERPRDYERRYDPDEERFPPPVSSGRYSQPGEKFRSVEDFFHRLGRRFERRSDQLKRFFTGDEPR
jgi:hypothetical protein